MNILARATEAARPRTDASADPAPATAASSEALAVSARGLGRRFGRRWALAHLELAVEAGEALLVAGPNGSGKTTLLRLLAGLYRPTRGSLSVFGRDLDRDRPAWRRSVALLGHHTGLYDRLSALETARLWAEILGRPGSDTDLLPSLREVGLDRDSDRPVAGFSAGMRKRLALLRIRLKDPRLVLLDEPFAAFDEAGQRLIERWITDYRNAGRTVILASHALARSARLCDRALLLESGQVAWQGPAERVVERTGGEIWAA